jgi:hypothetical protein
MIFTSSKRPRGEDQNSKTNRAAHGSSPVSVEGLEGRRLMTAVTLAFTATQYVFHEGELRAIVTVQRAGDDPVGDAYVNYTTTDGSAKANVNYLPTSGQLVFRQGGPTTQQIIVPLIDNASVDGNKSFGLTLADVDGADTNPNDLNFENTTDVLVAPFTTEVVIADDDAALQFQTTTFNVAENAGVGTVTVQRLGTLTDHVQVDVTTFDVPGGATEGVDYTGLLTPVTLDFLPGEASKTVSITINTDALDAESTEAVGFQLSNPRIIPPATPPGPGPIVPPTNLYVYGAPNTTLPAGSAILNIQNTDNTAPTITGVTTNLGRRNRFESITIQFSEPLRQSSAEAINSYGIFNRNADGAFATGRRSDVRIRSASYNAANNTVTLVPQGAFALNRIYQLVVYGVNGPVDLSGNAVDTDANAATPPRNYATFFGVGSAITYTDFDGDLVRLRITRGLMDVRRTLNGAASSVSILQSDPSRSILTGTVTRRGANGNGLAVIQTLGPVAGVQNKLTNPPFVIQNLI